MKDGIATQAAIAAVSFRQSAWKYRYFLAAITLLPSFVLGITLPLGLDGIYFLVVGVLGLFLPGGLTAWIVHTSKTPLVFRGFVLFLFMFCFWFEQQAVAAIFVHLLPSEAQSQITNCHPCKQ
jgi:hypothetical protein